MCFNILGHNVVLLAENLIPPSSCFFQGCSRHSKVEGQGIGSNDGRLRTMASERMRDCLGS
jgi:hypothetical protein